MTDKIPGLSIAATISSGPDSIEILNSECFCISLDTKALKQALESEIGQPGLFDLIQQRCPYLFATRPVFVSQANIARMEQVVHAIESVVALPAYREEILGDSAHIASHNPGGAKGVFFGYDFHVTEGGFGLIEINTNAGGAMLNAVLARAHRACCPAIDEMVTAQNKTRALEDDIVAMFHQEWSLSGHKRALRSIAIVDENPTQQYLYPEFLLFQQLFQRHGLEVVIADPSEFTLHEGVLKHGKMNIDLVYNRLTDFSLSEPASATLREAYLQNAIVLTPNPQAHALFADKRNLVLLSDPTRLQVLGVPKATQDILLASIPRTEVVLPENAERLWQTRRGLFFKPFAGFGGRAAYRGDKLTKRVWKEILAGGYIAQALVIPGSRVISDHERAQVLKFDLRNYTYDDKVQWVAARLYQGQTTNFRTLDGGFAPVYEGPVDPSEITCSTIPESDNESSHIGGHHNTGCLESVVQHETRLFLIEEDTVKPLEHEHYLALVRGKSTAQEYAGRRFTLVDWYVRLVRGQPEAVVNETYSWLVFDAQGRLDFNAAHEIDAETAPTEAHWAQLKELVFGAVAVSNTK
ncbi:hypothetical protein [Paraglaciecola polaris]|uniref:Uncharacterized protein n=1 Tax=Paraglaciecola polaris LMG 21857 TaxID=1129793 RepID=K7A2U4_9ALTE|nr:hypothetical protein [Paraglaciecola polaris]GAC35233.1 hypothetical protein GPLA_4354 [Paraglaciecola polaris LMG 21857]|tara:strand:+ start:5360 stop:7102 length:1743 start_codon:yes stop_codon:yes gene_type:complete